MEREQTGLRHIAGYGVTVTRGAASAMMFTYSSLLITMCRNTITILRDTFLHIYIPFDSAVSFHKYIAIWALVFTGKFKSLKTSKYVGHFHVLQGTTLKGRPTVTYLHIRHKLDVGLATLACSDRVSEFMSFLAF